ncbi:aminopeptidase, partial [Candidatus Parcubacteria bacterium]
EESIAFLKTHYYGGIKKYQWPTIALALHGVVYLANGKSVEIVIGEKEDDPIFMITDLLPHLDRAGGPGSKISARQIEGEELNLVVGSMPIKDEKIKERVKLAVLEHLHKHYGIVEEDLASAELHAVPSEKARDLGFDRSLISGYGHDDRSCAYASLLAFLGAKLGDETQVCFWVDREEIGSEGNTGAKSMFVEMLFSELLRLSGERFGINNVYHIFTKSKAISADVAPAVDPDYKDVHDLRNAHRLGFGVAMERYTGSGGKYHSSEASGQLVQEIRMIFARTPNIVYQLGGGLGKIDKGGGGTIAMYLANRNMDIVDMGVPVLNMHAPLEIISKADLYAAYLAYQAFLAG